MSLKKINFTSISPAKHKLYIINGHELLFTKYYTFYFILDLNNYSYLLNSCIGLKYMFFFNRFAQFLVMFNGILKIILAKNVEILARKMVGNSRPIVFHSG